uniref:Integrase catalytic domain-containing protein n=1 Tax=Arundo donax TaxID=35708 RepID=A0A0A9G4J8_ARUDO
MDFIEGLPRVNGKSVILTVVDRFSKSAHFLPLAHLYTASSVAKIFFGEIVRLHGFPSSIVSYRDPIFTSNFWKEIFHIAVVKLNMSTAFHPQTDGQSEAANKIIAMYLRCLTGDRPRQWLQWLPWAEYCYNTAYQATIRTSPFSVVYGREPPVLRPCEQGEAIVPAVEQMMKDRDEFLVEIRERLEQAQQHYKSVYDRSHRELEFLLGQWVWLRLLHRAMASMPGTTRGKLGPRFVEPYKVLERIGEVAYRLQLPQGAKLHNVFHVGLLKPFRGEPSTDIPPLPPVQHGRAVQVPAKIVRARLARGVVQVLVQWQDCEAADASWVPLNEFKEVHPDFQLEDELLDQAGRDVMVGITYKKRDK